MITRCEAFMDSLEHASERATGAKVYRKVDIDHGTHRTVMIPNMSAHAYALAAAFRSCGMNSEVLPPQDEETLEWGRQFTTGKECFPCIVTTGDMVKFTKRQDFDRDKYAFFMGGSGGPCRFGQYNALQRMVLDQLGYPDVPIYAPNQASSFYDDIGIVGRKLLEQGWKGIVCIDMIEKCLRETRPYEMVKGSTDGAFDRCVGIVSDAIARDADLVTALRECRKVFEQVQIDRTVQKPIIGYVGEFYVRANAYSNQDIVRKIEQLGGEVWGAPLLEWLLYRNVRRAFRARLVGDLKLWGKNRVMDLFMKKHEHDYAHVFEGYLRNCYEPSTAEVLDMAEPYVHRSFEGEAIMTVGKAVDFVNKGLAGVVAVMPFTCMPGTISNALLKRVREEMGEFPFLNMVYDGVEQATSQTRIEAFMHQAKEYAKRLDR
jgi:predicted nucleotide-binding protein (sugar kinase/HSP70/actin superfamily)